MSASSTLLTMGKANGLRVDIVTPAARGTHNGNRVTALRWAKRLRELGHQVSLSERYDGTSPDCLVALHAVKSADSVERCRAHSSRTLIVVALAGTDVYGEELESRDMRRTLEVANAIVALQPLAIEALPPALRDKSRVIYQSAAPA